MHELYKLKDKLCEELEEYGGKKLDAGALEVVDKLTHAIKNLDKIIDKYEGNDYSNDGRMNESYGYGTAHRPDFNSYRSNYSRRRDRMGRYSTKNDAMIAELRELMQDAPDDRTREEFRAFIQRVESM